MGEQVGSIAYTPIVDQGYPGGGSGTITQITSGDPAVIITDPNGPNTTISLSQNLINASKLKIEMTAGEVISATKFVYVDAVTGKSFLGDHSDYTKSLVIGIAETSALVNSVFKVICAGIVTDYSWNWSTNAILFLGANGLITDVQPVSGFRVKIGKALTPTDILIEISEPITI